MAGGPASDRTRVRREPQRGVYHRATIDAILDEGLVCHLGFAAEGQPYVIPTLFARIGDEVYLHGSSASRMLRTLHAGVDACLTVTLVDGIVLARSIFNHSINYRSVVVLGRAVAVADAGEKLRALEAFSARLLPGRWADVRAPTATELKATSILRMPLEEASAKVRAGPPKDDEDDYRWPVWAGVIPLALVAGDPVPDPGLEPGFEPPVWSATDRIRLTPGQNGQ
ncbi:MAG TPA: pyridoxamine 5'-phosphate oxidase family protein [Gaiellaceae bacterium]|jgi:nitroimidazol reductase NimA-like FMN-containing flavoprotein (pyridoxamine 5'-phosphate oxidase superfamily)